MRSASAEDATHAHLMDRVVVFTGNASNSTDTSPAAAASDSSGLDANSIALIVVGALAGSGVLVALGMWITDPKSCWRASPHHKNGHTRLQQSI